MNDEPTKPKVKCVVYAARHPLLNEVRFRE
ncbi:hypothetical+protein [Methylocapsa aurea]